MLLMYDVFTIQITKEEVESFRSSTASSSIPSCELHIRWEDKDQNPPDLDYCEIKLLGAKRPNDYFLVSLKQGKYHE